MAMMEEAQQGKHGAAVLPVYTALVARLPLEPAQWQRVPPNCPGLGAALPAVLDRSAEEAALLVHHPPPAHRERLRTAARCLARVQRPSGVALPADVVRPLLMAAVVG